MEYACLIGKSDMRDFTTWWEHHLPSWVMVYCYSGKAELTLLFKSHEFSKGMISLIAPDMYPSFSSISEDFKVFYCLMEITFADKSFYGVPSGFFDAIYVEPVLNASATANVWIELLNAINENDNNLYRQDIISDIMHAFALDYCNKWEQQHGDYPSMPIHTSAEAICMKFYDLVFLHFKEHRNTAFYADKLCITPCYLAMVTRQVCHETPKQAIDRQVTLEMKYILQNTDMTAEQIADYMNFPDTSYMCRFFRRHAGMTLSEYRKGKRNNN